MDIAKCIHWRGLKLRASLHFPAAYNTHPKGIFPLIIICHGFTSSRIGVDRLFVKSAVQLEREGNIVVRFDYAGCGESEGQYGENSFDDLIEQTQTVITFGTELPGVDRNQVTLIGHSLGGAVAAITAAKDHRVKNLVLWSAVGRPYDDISAIVGPAECDEIEKSRCIDHLGYTLTPKFLESLKRFNPIEKIARFNGHALIIHGTGDKVITSEYAKHYVYSLKEKAEKTLIQGACHTFSTGPHFDQLINRTKKWMRYRTSSEERMAKKTS
ncbi:alpha/beta hydrolase [Fictibacillus iocasae]|uniref:Alpha/beta hydrolase n=1 Tax=Fictibacillus iocasae TaxID=2715437 RepID=A0ABW2NLV3_9BACL